MEDTKEKKTREEINGDELERIMKESREYIVNETIPDLETNNLEKSSKNETGIQAVKFALFSASAGIIQAIVFALMNETLSLPYWPSYLTALVLSVLWNFTFNRKITFKSAVNIPLAMLKVAGFYAVFTPLSTTIGNYFAETKGVNEYIVLGVTMAFNLTLEFVYDKFFVFNDKKEETKEEPKAE